MPNFTAKDVNALRQRTSMGMMECKKALTDADGNTEKAVALLRERAGGKMADRGDREAVEGAVASAQNDSAITLVALTAETDFAARNEEFEKTVQMIADGALGFSGQGVVTDQATAEMKDAIENLRITIKENISLKGVYRLEGERFASYVHTNKKNGAIIAATGDIDSDLLKGLAMHVTAATPPVSPEALAVDADGLPQEKVDAAQKEFTAEAEATGKPKEIAEKIAQGKMKKWSDEHTLLGQIYIRELDAKKPVRDYIPAGVQITGFVRSAVS